jgi:uncharacterized repeat protein (TIGR01451 family)
VENIMKSLLPKAILAALAALALAGLAWFDGTTRALGSNARDRDPAVAPAPRDNQNTAAPQPVESDRAHHAGAATLAYPTGDRNTSTLLIEVVTPAQVPVGRAYDYQIRVTNLTRNLTLENLRVYQTRGENFAIQASDPKAKEDRHGETGWTIPQLPPGQTSTIKVTGLGEREGRASNCIRVTYEPTLCVTTEYTKPAVQVAKEAPKAVDICDPIDVRYVVRNSGTGPARGLRLHEELPKDLATADGGRAVAFDIGDLAQGQAREFTARLLAARTGTYTGRAVAEGQDELKAQSNQTTTAVQQSKLTVDLVGPEAEYADQRATYRATVKNEGRVAARGARLEIQADPNFRVLRVSKADPQAITPRISGNTLSWDLGDLGPGGQAVVSFTGSTRGWHEIRHAATVSSHCARGGDFASAVTDTIATEVQTLPALLLELVDKEDPVQVGTNAVYTIVVLNQGESEDRNVKVVCRLPDGLQYVDSGGPTKGTAEGQAVSFGPVERLGPKERATWTVTAKAAKAGDVRTRVELTSDYLTTPVTETEPTRLIQ